MAQPYFRGIVWERRRHNPLPIQGLLHKHACREHILLALMSANLFSHSHCHHCQEAMDELQTWDKHLHFSLRLLLLWTHLLRESLPARRPDESHRYYRGEWAILYIRNRYYSAYDHRNSVPSRQRLQQIILEGQSARKSSDSINVSF